MKGVLRQNVKCLLPRRSVNFPYMQTFADAWKDAGGAVQEDFSVAPRLRGAIGHLGLAFHLLGSSGRMLCLGSGRIESVAWPWCYNHEIIPVMWDLWPEYIEPFCSFVKKNNVRIIFCTARCQVDLLRERMPNVSIEWMPEGVDVALYPKGDILKNRKIDVLEYGRRLEQLHESMVNAFKNSGYRMLFQVGSEHLFNSFEELTAGIRHAKIAICYPQSITNPNRAGRVETLTQRYWECMLSGTLMCGHAPKELIDLCGYNPVVELEKPDPTKVIEILDNVEEWQSLADKNRDVAASIAGWDMRVERIKKVLEAQYS